MSTLEKKHKNSGLLLGLIGALLIATGILMIPSLTEKKLEQFKRKSELDRLSLQKNSSAKQENPPIEKNPAPKILKKVTAGDHDNNVLNNKQIQNKKINSDTVKVTDSDIKQTGKWTIIIDEKTYSFADNADLIITRIVNAIKADPQIIIKISGINSSRKSSKRALHAAGLVADKLRGLIPNSTLHIKQAALQTSDATGIKVVVEFEKEDK